MPVTSDQIIVNNPSGSITIRLIDVQADGVMVGVIERLEPLENFPQGEEHIGLRAIVKVPGAEYVATLIPC
jgi:hypothetical protein